MSVGLEAIDVGNVDDVVVRYTDPPHEYTQVRFAVDTATPLTVDYLTSTKTPGGTSMLQKFFASWQRLGAGDAPRLQLITNRAASPADPVLSQIDGRSGLLVPALAQAREGTALGRARLGLAAHVNASEDELIRMLGCLHFRLGRAYDAEVEHASDLMGGFGLDDSGQAVRRGIDRIRLWVLDGTRELTIAEIRDGIEALGIRVAEPAATLLIQTLDRDPNPDDADEALDWVDWFEDTDPMARRRVISADAYPAMLTQLRAASDRLLAAGHHRVNVRGPMRLPSWFAAGWALAEVRGVHLRCGRHGQPWATDDSGTVDMDVDLDAVADIASGTAIAVAAAFAADPTDDVVSFVRSSGLLVNRVVRIGLDGGRIENGAQAVAVAQQVKDKVREQLRASRSDHVHLFMAAPAGLALFLGHRWNRVAPTTVWEDVVTGYEPAFDIPG